MGAPTDSGRVIAGRYRLREQLGSGGMGTVWLARDELLRRDVAVKEVLPPAGLSDSEREMLRERTLQEARMAARLSHPNVVRIYDVAEDDGRPWIVMELIRARSLSEMVDESGPLDVRAVARVGLQLIAALRSAHAIGVMHRDVKPGNVLMAADGRAVLADFGIARAEDSPATTTSGVLVGSPSYIAPERARGGRGGPASDLWSLGATLYAAVEGRPPYDRAGALPTLMAVVSEEPDPPRHAGMMWPVISGLLAADQSGRLGYAAAEQMMRKVAESDAASVTAPMPAADPLPGSEAADPGTAQARLRRAGHTQALHSLARRSPELFSGQRQPPEPSQTPRTGLPVVHGSLPTEAEPSTTPGTAQLASDEDPRDRSAVVPAGADDAPAPATPVVVPAPARWEGGATKPRQHRTRLLVLAAALIAAAAATAGLYFANRPAAGSPAAGRPDHSASAPARSHAATPGTPRARSQPGTATSPRSRSTPPVAKTTTRPKFGDQATVPPGYHTYRDPTGFSIAMPNGWNVSHQGHYVYLRPPSGPSYLLIDQSDHPQPSPLADWQQQEASRRATYAGYQRIRLAAIHYPQAEKAADWEFTYYHDSVLTHVLNRNILANAQHAYALYWSTPESKWSSEYPIFAVLARTFQPARPTS
jgi:eukaryotic-like serine/threonine-protein kinase